MNLNNEGNIIKIEAMHEYTLFPKYPVILGKGENNSGIVKWSVINVIEGEPITDKNGCITVKGQYEEEIDIIQTYTILAKEIEHPQYGKQYQLIYIGEILDLSSVRNQKSFLRTFLTGLQIDEMFKVLDDPLKIIDSHDIKSLKKVHGVGDYIANSIIERYESKKDYCNVYLELDGLGLTPNFIQKLIKQYQNPNKVIKIVKENPYQLSFDIEGIGFKTADKIALNNGMNLKSPERIKGYINYLLNRLGEEGNSYITAGELTGYIYKEFDGMDNIVDVYKDEDGNVIDTNIGVAIADLEKQGILIVEKHEKKTQRRVYLKKYWELENDIANELKRISEAENCFEFVNWEDTIKEEEQKQGWLFEKEQVEGIKACLNNQITLITGLAGSGKTSVLTGVLKALRCYEGKYSFAQTSLAGRAAARMSEVTGAEGYTIHRLLQIEPPNGFYFNEKNPLPYNIIILDEISLVGGEIFLSLIKAIKNGSKLIILGDLGQLESIGCLNLAHDLYESQYIKTVELLKIHRQARKSGIKLAGKAVREHEQLFDNKFEGKLTLGELKDMHFDVSLNKDTTKKRAVNYFNEFWGSDLVTDIMDIQILSPIKERGDASVFDINLEIQKIVNPSSPTKNERKIQYDKEKTFFLREGDKVMNLKNNHKLCDTHDKITPVFNGWVGILEEIDELWGHAVIYFPIIKNRVIFPFYDLSQSVILSYASTVHKFQGSDSKVVIGVLDYSTPPKMRTKELAYTLITRAGKLCVFVVQNGALRDAIETSGVSYKNTFLVELLDNKQNIKL